MKIEHLEIIDSTSEYMKRKKNREEYEVVYADEQTGVKVEEETNGSQIKDLVYLLI